MIFHTSAALERDALAAGGLTPIVAIHLALQVVSHPLLGAAVALLALAESGRFAGRAPWGWVWRAASVIGAVGALAHALAAPVVILTRNVALEGLFAGAGPMALYLGLLGIVATRFGSRVPRVRGTTAAVAPQPA
jgi:hypothetical protein